MTEPKRGRTGGRRRSVVSMSLDGLALLDLERLQAIESEYVGRPVSRSRMVRLLISRAAADQLRDNRGFGNTIGPAGLTLPAVGKGGG